MDEVVLMASLTLFTLLAGLCSIVFNKIKLPPLIGYLMAGIIIANFWHTTEEGEVVVSILSDMGLIMLMFCIGMEINLKKIRKQGLFAIEVAVIQLPLMVLGGTLAGAFLGFDFVQSIALGAIISGSSTAVVVAVLKSQNRLDKEHIDMLVLITIMEDIGQVIILSMITPLLAGADLDADSLIAMILSIAVFMVASIFIGLKLMPRIINWVSDNVTSEVLVVFSVGLGFGMALLASYVGLSVAIGAFLMGMMIASSRKSKSIAHDIEPMKNLFMAMFFISVGMEISLVTLWENILLILIIYVVFAVLKTSTVFLGYWVGNESCRTGFMSAVGLVAMGEFAFIIAKEALDYGVVDNAFYTSVVGAALISMIVLPLLTKSSTLLWDKATLKCPEGLMRRFEKINKARSTLYTRVSAASKKSRRELSTKMTRTYVCILGIAAIELVFYFLVPYAKVWLVHQFGMNELLWSSLLLLLNFILLFVPLYIMVKNIQYVFELSIAGEKRMSRFHEVRGDSFYSKFVTFSATLIAVIVDIIILMIVPNDLGTWEHIAVFLVAIVCIIIYYKLTNKKALTESYDTKDDFDSITLEKFKQITMNRYKVVQKAEAEEREMIPPAPDQPDGQ